MAEKQVPSASKALRDVYLNPLNKVDAFFKALGELRQAADAAPNGNTRCERESVSMSKCKVKFQFLHTHIVQII